MLEASSDQKNLRDESTENEPTTTLRIEKRGAAVRLSLSDEGHLQFTIIQGSSEVTGPEMVRDIRQLIDADSEDNGFRLFKPDPETGHMKKAGIRKPGNDSLLEQLQAIESIVKLSGYVAFVE